MSARRLFQRFVKAAPTAPRFLWGSLKSELFDYERGAFIVASHFPQEYLFK